ncbi:unnamed protein product [Rhizoctonia solani]|uniref:F-box domain-containing protein n=1 Tax=Rhizoctonia solani TaxID=456999 RepID=A0A8H3BHM2_9AGAM|nr:unnamed protein product [Rhizoctonia solani]
MEDHRITEDAPCTVACLPKHTHQLDTELPLSPYERNVKRFKAVMGDAYKCSSEPGLINTLPTELLIHIFHLVLVQPCNLRLIASSCMDEHYIRYPDYLAHVCSLWRKISIFTGSLWCHIDLTSCESYLDKLTTRAEICAARSGKLPIELHVAESSLCNQESSLKCYTQLFQFVSNISNRVETLDFVVTGYFHGFRSAVLREVLTRNPTLMKIKLDSVHGRQDAFITSILDDIGVASPNLKVDLPEADIESAFAPLTTLHLHGIFPKWSSKAYHGLIDLRLLSTRVWSNIKLMDLVTILEGSPGLQILHFGLKIRRPTPRAATPSPVYLQDLQVVKILPVNADQSNLRPSRLLRLLAPGPKPLRLCFGGKYKSYSCLAWELDAFFRRSKVTRFYTRAVFPPMGALLRHANDLECVVLDGLKPYPSEESTPTWLQADKLGSPLHLRSLHITRSIISDINLRLLVDFCPNGIVLHDSYIYLDSIGENSKLNHKDISETFPTVRTTGHVLYPSNDPTAEWDILD